MLTLGKNDHQVNFVVLMELPCVTQQFQGVNCLMGLLHVQQSAGGRATGS